MREIRDAEMLCMQIRENCAQIARQLQHIKSLSDEVEALIEFLDNDEQRWRHETGV